MAIVMIPKSNSAKATWMARGILIRSNVEVTGAARLYRAASGGPQGYAFRREMARSAATSSGAVLRTNWICESLTFSPCIAAEQTE